MSVKVLKEIKIKKMPFRQFKDALERKWRPVKLERDSIPDFLKNIPEEMLSSVYVSGDTIDGISYLNKVIPSGDIIGGIDVYRDPVDLNRDWYPVISTTENKTMLLIKVPIKEKNKHWMREISEGLIGAEVLAVPKEVIKIREEFQKWRQLSVHILRNISKIQNQRDFYNWYQSTMYISIRLLRLTVASIEDLSYMLPWSLQFTNLLNRFNRSIVTLSYCLINGFVSIAIMFAIAMLSKNPFIFPSLGPTAFLFFFSPKLPASSPRNTLIGHSLGIFAGWFSLLVFGLLDGVSVLEGGFTWQRVIASGLSLGLTCGLMSILACPHPPAGATTLIISLWLITSYFGLFCMMLAVILLTIQAFIINRAAGIDYPIWKAKT